MPGALLEEDFRGNFTAALWEYARKQGLLDLASEYRRREGKEEYLLILGELTMLGEWLCAFLLWCKSPVREKCAGEDIVQLAQTPGTADFSRRNREAIWFWT